MGTIDLIARCLAITILLFVASFLVLTLLSYWLSPVLPLRHALLIAGLSAASAATPMVVVRLTRAAAGAKGGAAPNDNALALFAILICAFALLFASLLVGGQLRL